MDRPPGCSADHVIGKVSHATSWTAIRRYSHEQWLIDLRTHLIAALINSAVLPHSRIRAVIPSFLIESVEVL